jgi:2-desacetyl-2-hydroxyethyl bacteriochlorophyllide A dehydrogenase
MIAIERQFSKPQPFWEHDMSHGTMRAAVFEGEGRLTLQERPIPAPGPDDVLVQVAACGICGTDRHIMHGEFATAPPVIIGHEYAGTVAAVGAGVRDVRVGDQVAIDPNIVCGQCRPCQRGQVHMCRHLTALGVNRDGGFAEYALAPRRQCYVLAPHMPLLEWAMTEPLACCIHGIDLACIRAGDRVAVIGGGAIGQIMAQLARLSGAGLVAVSDTVRERREMALRLGADAVVDPTSVEPVAPGEMLDGGADVIIEAVGSRATNRQAIAWAAPGGTVLWFGVTPPGHTVEVEPNLIFEKELRIQGARINPFTHSRAVALLASGRIQVEPLITQQIGLEALPAELAQPSPGQIKTVVTP